MLCVLMTPETLEPLESTHMKDINAKLEGWGREPECVANTSILEA